MGWFIPTVQTRMAWSDETLQLNKPGWLVQTEHTNLFKQLILHNPQLFYARYFSRLYHAEFKFKANTGFINSTSPNLKL